MITILTGIALAAGCTNSARSLQLSIMQRGDAVTLWARTMGVGVTWAGTAAFLVGHIV